MPTAAENKTTLQNLLTDAATLAEVVTENKTVTPRTGSSYPSIPKLVADKGADLDAETANAARWAAEDEDTPVSGGLFSARHYAAKAEEDLETFRSNYLGSHANVAAAEAFATSEGITLASGLIFIDESANVLKYRTTGGSWVAPGAPEGVVPLSLGGTGETSLLAAIRTLDIRRKTATVAAMKGLTKADLADGETIAVKRYVAGSPVRWRRYVWNADSTITPDDVVVIQHGDAGNGRFFLVMDGPVTPIEAGALYDDPGDGSGTNDLVAAQKAADAAAAWGLPFSLEGGDTRWNGGFVTPSNLRMVGDAKLARIIDTRSAGYTPLIECREKSGWNLSGFGVKTINSFSANEGYGASQILIRDGSRNFALSDIEFEGPTQRCVTVLNSVDGEIERLRGTAYLNALLRIASDHVMDTISIDEADTNPLPVSEISVKALRARGTDGWTSTTKTAQYGVLAQSLNDGDDSLTSCRFEDIRVDRTTTQGVSISGKLNNVSVSNIRTSRVDNENATYSSRTGIGLLLQFADGAPANRVKVTDCFDIGSFIGQWAIGDASADVFDVIWNNNAAVDNIRNAARFTYAKRMRIGPCLYAGVTGGGEALTSGNGDGVRVEVSDDITFSQLTCVGNAGRPASVDSGSARVTFDDIVESGNGTSGVANEGSSPLLLVKNGQLTIAGDGVTLSVESYDNSIPIVVRFNGSIVGYIGTLGASGDLVMYNADLTSYVNITDSNITSNKAYNSAIHYQCQGSKVVGPRESAIGKLTDSSGGSAGTTIAAVSGSGADAAINNALASLTAKFNLVVDRMGISDGHGLTAD